MVMKRSTLCDRSAELYSVASNKIKVGKMSPSNKGEELTLSCIVYLYVSLKVMRKAAWCRRYFHSLKKSTYFQDLPLSPLKEQTPQILFLLITLEFIKQMFSLLLNSFPKKRKLDSLYNIVFVLFLVIFLIQELAIWSYENPDHM